MSESTLVPDHALPKRSGRNESLDRSLIALRCSDAIRASRKTIPAIAAECSVSAAAINGLMAGRSLPSLALAVSLSRATNVSLGWLAGIEEARSAESKDAGQQVELELCGDAESGLLMDALGVLTESKEVLTGAAWMVSGLDSRGDRIRSTLSAVTDCAARINQYAAKVRL